MDWVHCNKCFCQPQGPNKRKFLITNCGHLFCDQCNDGSLQQCFLCQKDVTAMYIDSSMGKDMEPFFQDPNEAVRQQLVVFDFQNGHRLRLINFLQDKCNKYLQQKSEIAMLKEENKRHRNEKNKLKDELNAKIEEIRALKQQMTNSSGQSQSLFSFDLNKNLKYANSNRPFNSQSSFNNNSKTASFSSGKENQFTFRLGNELDSSPKDNHLFTPPLPVSYANSYREMPSSGILIKSQQKTTPTRTSPTPEALHRQHIQRKVLLPGDKGCSPNRIGLQRLTIKTPTPSSVSRTLPSPSIKVVGRNVRNISGHTSNKYNKYF